MLDTIKDIIGKQLAECIPNISLEQIELLGKEKLAATIATSHLMGSIEILKDFTTDLLVVEFESEEVLYSETFNAVFGVEELREIIDKFLIKIDAIEQDKWGQMKLI